MFPSLAICLWSTYLLGESHLVFIWSPCSALLLPCVTAIRPLLLLSTSWCSCPAAMSLSSLSFFLSWAFVPPDCFSLYPSFFSKSFLYPAPSGSWCSCPTSFSFSSHPGGQAAPQLLCLAWLLLQVQPLSHHHLNQKFLCPRAPRMHGDLGACLEQTHGK